MPSPQDYLQTARRIADHLLFPDAMAVERTGTLPAGHLAALADAGLYGVAAPVADGGIGIDDLATMSELLEILAAACLSTAFVWTQHHGTVASVAASGDAVRDRWLGPLCRGELRAGIALAGLRSEPGLRIRPVDGGFELDGSCPWVTGWGSITTIGVAARDDHDVVHHLLVDAAASPTLTARPHELVAVQASGTVTLEFATTSSRPTGCWPPGRSPTGAAWMRPARRSTGSWRSAPRAVAADCWVRARSTLRSTLPARRCWPQPMMPSPPPGPPHRSWRSGAPPRWPSAPAPTRFCSTSSLSDSSERLPSCWCSRPGR